MAKRSLTPEQDMVFGQIERAMLPAFEDAWTKLTAAGFEADEDTIYCTACDENSLSIGGARLTAVAVAIAGSGTTSGEPVSQGQIVACENAIH